MDNLRANKVASFGGYGFQYITTTSAYTPATGYRFVMIHMVTEGAITTAGNPTGNLTAATLPASFPLYGMFNSITTATTAATAIAYLGKE